MSPALTGLRHRIHAWPETAYEEHKTAQLIAGWLERLPGMRVRRGVGGTGVIGDLDPNKPGPCLALRADMDALPVQEKADRPYASRRAGLMHACGHDGHVACLLGAATILAQRREALAGPLRFIFQPAEEGGAGAARMIAEGALDDPPARAIFAMHGNPHLPLANVDLRQGTAYASTDALDIRVGGSGTHAASPHLGTDPILAASHVVMALQTVVSRNTAATDALVVTIGEVNGGTTRNVIPEEVILRGTVRALDNKVRQAALARIRHLVGQTASAYGARAEIDITPGYPRLKNDHAAASFWQRAAAACPELKARVNGLPPSLGGEDFAYYLERIPGAIWCLGLKSPGHPPLPSLHHPTFDFPDAAIAHGVRMHCALALAFGRESEQAGSWVQ